MLTATQPKMTIENFVKYYRRKNEYPLLMQQIHWLKEYFPDLVGDLNDLDKVLIGYETCRDVNFSYTWINLLVEILGKTLGENITEAGAFIDRVNDVLKKEVSSPTSLQIIPKILPETEGVVKCAAAEYQPGLAEKIATRPSSPLCDEPLTQLDLLRWLRARELMNPIDIVHLSNFNSDCLTTEYLEGVAGRRKRFIVNINLSVTGPAKWVAVDKGTTPQIVYSSCSLMESEKEALVTKLKLNGGNISFHINETPINPERSGYYAIAYFTTNPNPCRDGFYSVFTSEPDFSFKNRNFWSMRTEFIYFIKELFYLPCGMESSLSPGFRYSREDTISESKYFRIPSLEQLSHIGYFNVDGKSVTFQRYDLVGLFNTLNNSRVDVQAVVNFGLTVDCEIVEQMCIGVHDDSHKTGGDNINNKKFKGGIVSLAPDTSTLTIKVNWSSEESYELSWASCFRKRIQCKGTAFLDNKKRLEMRFWQALKGLISVPGSWGNDISAYSDALHFFKK